MSRSRRDVDAEAPAAVFACLSDRQRLMVLRMVADAPGSTASALAAELPITRQGVAKHLGVLADAGLVRAERVGREVRHHVQPEPLRTASRWLDLAADSWDQRLASLKQVAEEVAAPGDRR